MLLCVLSMTIKALFYAYVLGGLTFIPLVLACLVLFTVYTAVPVEPTARKSVPFSDDNPEPDGADVNDIPKPRKGWLTVRRTFEESTFDGSYVALVRTFLDSRSKDPKRSRPKDMWYVVLKGRVLYLYENEAMTECEAVIELGSHEVAIYPDNLLDGELFTKRNAICLKAKPSEDKSMPSLTKQMKHQSLDLDSKLRQSDGSSKQKAIVVEQEKQKEAARAEALEQSTPWFIFVRSTVEMEDWYLALVHASDWPPHTPTLSPLRPIFLPSDMDHLVSTLDEQPDVIPMRWLNALLGRIFYSFYRTQLLESFIIGRLMKKLSKVKRPAFLADVVVTEVSVGNTAPTFSKPMLKELTKEGDASLEVHVKYKGEIRITVEATATINLGARFKSYAVKLVLAVVLKELDGNLLVKVKRPPSNRIWYAFTQTPTMVLEVEPIVSDRQITWSMILSTIESRLKEIIQESVVMPNMDDIAFFESSSYKHRGGIWSDAVKTQKDPTIQRQDLVEEQEAPAEELDSEEQLPERPSSATPSWMETLPSSNDSADSPLLEEDAGAEVKRGRSNEIEKNIAGRSHSEPDMVVSPHSGNGERQPKESVIVQPMTHNRRSSSRGHESSDSEPGTSLTEPPTPTKASEQSRTMTGSPSSFLSTLKSRASDKQALSNTAKEAMRKWGVNWGGLRKDSNNAEDMPDHGTVGTRSSRSETANSRTTYAEVRAAVEERKREKFDETQPSTLTAPKERRISLTSNTGKTRFEDNNAWTEDSQEPGSSGSTFSPIHVQPQGKTMMIPGIHASHRGEVMSMGYVAPQSPPESSKSKNPVYRLWKSTQQPSESTDTSITTQDDRSEDRSLSSPPRATPPPLPPRRTPTSVTRPSLEPSEVIVQSSSASETLKTIATRDEQTRSSRSSVENT